MTTTKRVTGDEALTMLTRMPLAELLAAADARRRALHGDRTFFTASVNLNPTNICENQCDLCAFWRSEENPESYFLDLESAEKRLREIATMRATEIHVVGGVSPRCDLTYHEELFRLIRSILPNVLIQGLTAVEIEALARWEKIPIEETLVRLKAAGLGAVPGGGAEIFDPGVRSKICNRKISGDEWLEVHATAHRLGLPSNATMLFGHVESPESIVDHLDRIRTLQDRTGGFRAFIPLPFHPEGTRLDPALGPTGHEIARIAAVSRLYLDNVPHIRMLANYLDRKLFEVLVVSGVDDVGGTSFDERIAAAAGASADHRFGSAIEMAHFIERLGLEPAFVNSAYESIEWKEALPCQTHKPVICHSEFPRPQCGPTKAMNDGAQPPSAVPPKSTGEGACATLQLAAARERAADGERLSAADALLLAEHLGIHELGALAHAARCCRGSDREVTFVIDRNISITNVCEAACRFCAFHVPPESDGGFVLSEDEVVEIVKDSVRADATQVLIQGGLNPDLDLDFYVRLFARLKRETTAWIHSLSPTEIVYLARRAGLEIDETLRRLKEAGLDSLPGGGAEILVDDVRRRVSPKKTTVAEWLGVMRSAHALGLSTTATMVYGLGETWRERIEHFLRIRELQDETGGFTAFIPWSFQPNRTRLDLPLATGAEYLRVVALARLVLDNVPHLQAGWVTEGPDVAQLALDYGCDDFGGVLMEEKVVRVTGVAHTLNVERLIRLVRRAGRTPVQRTTLYDVIRKWSWADH